MSFKLPHKTRPFVFSALLSSAMSGIVSCMVTLLSIGFSSHFISHWVPAWGKSWLIAYPCVLIIAPIMHRVTDKIVAPASN